MRKWIYIFIIILIIVVWQLFEIYATIETGVKTGNQKAIQLAKQTEHFHQVKAVTAFRGHLAYHVILAKNPKNQAIYIWVPDHPTIQHPVFSQLVKDGVSKDAILQTMRTHFNYKNIHSIKLGMRKQVPVWEVSYIDASNRFSVTYFDFKTGEEISTINLQI